MSHLMRGDWYVVPWPTMPMIFSCWKFNTDKCDVTEDDGCV